MKTQTVTATEANRSFSRLLDAVKKGERVQITSHGEVVAEMRPVESDDVRLARQREALVDLRKHWAELTPVTVGPWTRDDLNARD